jgi:hypothetical protein
VAELWAGPECGRAATTATSSALPSATSQWRRWRTDPAPTLGHEGGAALDKRSAAPQAYPSRPVIMPYQSELGRADRLIGRVSLGFALPKTRTPAGAAGVPSRTGWVRGWGTWGHAIQWRLVNSGAARQFLQARKTRERPGETGENVTRLVSFGGKWPGTMAANRPSPVPAPTAR